MQLKITHLTRPSDLTLLANKLNTEHFEILPPFSSSHFTLLKKI